MELHSLAIFPRNYKKVFGASSSQDYSSILYCNDDIIQRAVRTRLCDPQGGCPRPWRPTQVGTFLVS
jgi:hypothetical protein